MREILFRGKRLDDGAWVFGYSIFCASRVFIVDRDDKTSLRGFTTNRCDKYDWRSVEVDPATVGQFTGLTDKNGKKIFEGDIIRILYEADSMPENVPETWAELYEVVFDDEHHAWFTKLDNGELGEWLYEYDGDCEVVGNIHDNPELLCGAE